MRQPWRAAKSDQDTLTLFVERHREIAVVAQIPFCHLLSGTTINDCNFPARRHIDKDSLAIPCDLETLRMSVERNVENPAPCASINYCKATAAVANEDLVCTCI
jgi:hypothetical protein